MDKRESGVINVLSIGIICCALCFLIIALLLNRYALNLTENPREVVTEKTLDVAFDGGKDISFKNLKNRTSIKRTITISLSEGVTSYSTFELGTVVNKTDISYEDFKYSLKCKNEGNDENSDNMPNKPGEYLTKDATIEPIELKIYPGETQTCEFELYYYANTIMKKNVFDSELYVKFKGEEAK